MSWCYMHNVCRTKTNINTSLSSNFYKFVMSHIFVVNLRRSDNAIPWGFRIEGGVDIGVPLRIMKVVDESIAYQSGLQSGDLVLQINNSNAERMSHEQAKMEIIRSANDIVFTLSRGGPQVVHKVWKQNVVSSAKIIPAPKSPTPRSPQLVTRTSIKCNTSPPQSFCAFNSVPVPFKDTQEPVITHDQTGRIKKIIHNEHNSPMGLYSNQNISQAFSSILQSANVAPVSPVKNPHLPSSMYCGSCGEMIKGVFVKIQGQIPMHPTCLKCCKCGVGLKNVGYFYINDKLYCETHAKQTARPAPGMQPMVVYK